ncbi:MAG: sugar-binding protein [Peptococcaceae bacterium]|jgi:putative multiple sugar transport system substrate-binding protein|nr:sugar-binding protein [Peptococcaceae bacterium]
MLVMAVALSACSRDSGEKTVGVSLPKRDVDRWTKDGDDIKKQLEAKGYKVTLEYADDDSDRQIAQIESMIDAGYQALIIAAKDCYVLNDVLEKAVKKGIKVIAYDRLIMDTEYVDYYCTFDNYDVGLAQGRYIEEAFQLNAGGYYPGNFQVKHGGYPINMELFSGAADDSTSPECYDGQMSVLGQYIDDGSVVIRSGQTSFEATAIADWTTENARARMEELLKQYYSDGAVLDVVLSTNDSMALGIIAALKQNGYGTDEKPLPVITGMDCDIDSVKAIINGEQSMSLLIDTRALATRVVNLTDDLLLGNEPKTNDTERFNNGVKVVPTSICNPIYVDKDNYMEVLVRDGYYSADDLK